MQNDHFWARGVALGRAPLMRVGGRLGWRVEARRVGLREVTAAAWREVAGLLAMAANAIEAGMVGSPVGGCWQPRCGS